MEAADLNEQVLQEIGFIIQEMDLPPGALAMRCLEVPCTLVYTYFLLIQGIWILDFPHIRTTVMDFH